MPRPPASNGAMSPIRSDLRRPKLAGLMDEAETDVLAYVSFPAAHRAKLHSTNPLERLDGEIKRRTEMVGIFPNEAAIIRLVGAIFLEQNYECAEGNKQRKALAIRPFWINRKTALRDNPANVCRDQHSVSSGAMVTATKSINC